MANERERFEIREVAGKIMSKFLCFAVYDGRPGPPPMSDEEQKKGPEPSRFNKEPISWCILGNGRIWVGPNLEYAKQQVLLVSAFAEFIEDCGWVFAGEEHKLLEREYQEILAYGFQLREQSKV